MKTLPDTKTTSYGTMTSTPASRVLKLSAVSSLHPSVQRSQTTSTTQTSTDLHTSQLLCNIHTERATIPGCMFSYSMDILKPRYFCAVLSCGYVQVIKLNLFADVSFVWFIEVMSCLPGLISMSQIHGNCNGSIHVVSSLVSSTDSKFFPN